MSKSLKLATFAVPLSGNKGSASMFFGLREAFAESEYSVEWSVFSYYPKTDDRLKTSKNWDDITVFRGHPNDLAFRLLPALVLYRLGYKKFSGTLTAEVKALSSVNVVLLIGGTTFSDSMLYKVAWNALTVLPGLLVRKPVLMLSQTLGPFNRWPNRAMARLFCRQVKSIHGRGRESRNLAQEIGLSHATYEPDLSFSLKVPNFRTSRGVHSTVRAFVSGISKDGCRIIALAPNTIILQKLGKQKQRYINFLIEVVRYTEQLGYLPVLIPHSYREDTNSPHNNDRMLCKHILRALPMNSNCEFIDVDLSPVELRMLIGQSELLIASRFHSMISALAMGIPPLTYGWGGHKYTEVLQEFGVEQLYHSYSEVDPRTAPGQIRTALDKREEYARRIEAALPTVVGQAQEIPTMITREIDWSKTGGEE